MIGWWTAEGYKTDVSSSLDSQIYWFVFRRRGGGGQRDFSQRNASSASDHVGAFGLLVDVFHIKYTYMCVASLSMQS